VKVKVKLLSALAALALAGNVPASAAPPASHEHVIAIAGMHFGAVPAGLRVGDTVLWVNRDIVVHSATARDRSFDVTLQPRQSVRVTLRRAGNVAFFCRFHPAMQGTLPVAAR
jgi:plastocyanin